VAQRRLSRWLSRHAAEFEREVRGDEDQVLGQLIDWLAATQRRPTNASPARLLEECERWHALGGDAPPVYAPQMPLPPAPFRPVAIPGVTARVVTTYGELVDEGSRMQHCVADRVDELLAGDSWVVSLSVDGVPFTAQLEREQNSIRVREIQGAGNVAPSADQSGAFEAWLARVNMNLRGADGNPP
jgi:hypothetical protein